MSNLLLFGSCSREQSNASRNPNLSDFGRETILSFAGRGNTFFRLLRFVSGSGDYQENRGKNDRASQQSAQSERLATQQPAEKQCHHRVNERISSHARGAAVLQNVNVSAETQRRTENDQVQQREPRFQRDACRMKTAKLAGK